MTSSRRVLVDLNGAELDAQLAPILRNYLGNIGGTFKARAQHILSEEVRDRSGALKRGIGFEIHSSGGKIYLEAYNNAPYAIYHEEGTGIYGPKGRPIRPKKAKLLSWIDPETGEHIFAKEVRGTPAIHFLERAIDFAIEQETRRINS